MSNIWPHVSKQNPCPICGKDDWCQIGDRSTKCMRIESTAPCKTGGWYHFTDEQKIARVLVQKPKAVPRVAMNFASTMTAWRSSALSPGSVIIQARMLGVSPKSLYDIGTAYSIQYEAFAFPMLDGTGSVVGIRLRNNQGEKWAVPGSRQGLFYPETAPDTYLSKEPVYICEGPTDTAAAITLGLQSIGRPSCNCSSEQLTIALKRIGARRVVIVADNDSVKRNGSMPGIDGAKRLKRELPFSSVIVVPPAKDIRDFLLAGGTRQLIESDLRNKVWKRG